MSNFFWSQNLSIGLGLMETRMLEKRQRKEDYNIKVTKGPDARRKGTSVNEIFTSGDVAGSRLEKLALFWRKRKKDKTFANKRIDLSNASQMSMMHSAELVTKNKLSF
jgi:hypothetical protein